MKQIQLLVAVLIISFSLSSCLRKDFDAPPDQSGYDPQLPVNASIVNLKALKPDPGGNTNGYVKIDTNFLIYGIVTADDKSGNLYKQINIEDSTGGIAILIDAYSLYNDFPVGRKIYVNLKGLYIGHYNGLPQIGYTPDNTGSITNIPPGLISKFITKASYPHAVIPKEYKLSEVIAYNSKLVNTVITIKDVQFQDAFLDKPYAAPAPVSGTDATVQDCTGATIAIRTSGYASFQPYMVSAGKGNLTALYTVYRGTPQLVIRDTTDVQFYGLRCDGSSGGAGNANVVTIDSLRKMFKGAAITLPSVKIHGVVISDIANGNVGTATFILQDGNKGVMIYGASGSYNLGDSLVIDVAGDELLDYNGTLELKIKKGKQNNIKLEGTKKNVTPVQLTIAQLASSYVGGYSPYESILVKVLNATATGGPTFGSNGNRPLNDGTGSLSMFTSSTSSFINTALPTGSKTYTGILGKFSATIQLRLRDPRIDVQ